MQNNNAIGWFDIYVADLERATKFYETVFNTRLEKIGDPTAETQMMGFEANMAVYGSAGALVKSEYSKPGVGGTLIYFNSADCLSEEKLVKQAGGRVVKAKFSIGSFGFVSICEDTEGNLFGLSSMK
jgi:uncharacterized protein